MSDHYDSMIASLRESMADAQKMADAGDIFSMAQVDAIKDGIVDLEREAAIWRAKTPEQRAADDAAREARLEAFEAACVAKESEPDDDDDTEEYDA
jgi:hypothetical protein